jgi:hypothetical protein
MNRPWFRMHAEAVDDEKLRLLAFEDRWHFVALLCLKAQGTLDSDAPRMEQRIALKLGLQLPQLDELKRRLLEIRLIDETFQPVSWGKRQYESDTSTERVRAHRAKVAAEKQLAEIKGGTGVQRRGNVSVTPSEQNRAEAEQSRAERRARDVSRGTSKDGTALTGMSESEEILAELTNAWQRDVEGVNVPELQRFFEFAERHPDKPKRYSATARISLAKKLSGMGDAEHQRRIVEQSMSADHVVLYPLKDRPAQLRKGDIDPAAKVATESRDWCQLKVRAEAIGFRARTPSDDLVGYRTLLERAENAAPRAKRIRTATELLARPS